MPADHYHMTILWAQVSTIKITLFLKLSAYSLLVFNWLQARFQVDFFGMVTSLLFEVNLGKSFHYENLDNNLTIYKQAIFLPF